MKRSRRGALLALSAAVLGGAARAGQAEPRVERHTALAAFREAWQRILAGAAQPSDLARLDELVQRVRPSAALRDCRALHALYVDRRGKAADAPPPLQGEPRALLRDGRCWALQWDARLRGGLAAAVDARTAQVLLVWRTIEG